MNTQQHLNFQRISEAIAYLQLNFKTQPDLEELAALVHLSPFHFQRLFTDWAGVSPKKFLQYISLHHAKEMLKAKQMTLFDAAEETGLSGTGRLHDLFVTIEGMTPGEFKNGGESLDINYSMADSPFGAVLVASTSRGICYIAFADDTEKALHDLRQHFPQAKFYDTSDLFQQKALKIFSQENSEIDKVTLHLKGTDFQLKVWEALLKIPMGQLSTYGKLSEKVGKPKASRAVGTAIGSNPVAFLIPCHRVIQSSGLVGGYMWGATRKTAMIGWEAGKTLGQSDDLHF